MEVHLENVISIWKKEAKDAESLIILSPYISSPTSDEVVKNIDGWKCKIYTLFSWHLFSQKSSSIQTLIKLKRKGCSINYLPELHAKIFLVPNKIASIGSQNFTLSGQNKKEATTFITDKHKLNEIHEQVLKWTADSKELSLDMLLDMRAAIKDMATEHEQLVEMSDNIRDQIFNKEKERNRVKTRSERLNEFAGNKTQVKYSSNKVFGKVRYIERDYGYSKGIYTLRIIDNNDSYLHWKINDEPYTLVKTMRYLIVSEDSGRIGWVRANKTQLSLVSNSLLLSEYVKLNRKNCKLSFSCIWDTKSDDNLMIIIKPENTISYIKCDCWFNLSRIQINEVKSVTEEKVEDYKSFDALVYNRTTKIKYVPIEACDISDSIIKWIKNNHDKFSTIIMTQLLPSFDYKHKLTGYEADIFFGYDGTCCSVRLGLLSGKKFLITNKI